MDLRAFKALPEADREILKNEPHYQAFRQVLAVILHRSSEYYVRESDIHVSVVCDEEEKYSVECLKIYTKLRLSYPDLRRTFVSIGFGDDKYYSQLQAADFIASVARQAAAHRFHGKAFDMNRLYDLFNDPRPEEAPVFGKFMDAKVLSELAHADREARKKRKI